MAVLIALIVVIAILGRAYPNNTPQTSSVVPVQSSSEETVDTSLSLEPPTTTISAPPGVAIISPPAPVSANCNLDLTFGITGGNLNSAGAMQYQLQSRNTGGATCTSPSISVYYANEESFVSSNPAATADGYYWRLPNLAPGAVYSIALTTSRTAALASGAVVNEACLSANNGADSCANASAVTPSVVVATPVTPSVSQTSQSVPTNKEFGVWVWTPVDQMTASEIQQTINEVAANNFTAIYLTIDDYLTTKNSSAYEQSLENFINLANQKGVVVDAEAGWRNWAEAGNTSNAPQIMSFVAAFNAAHTGKFRGVQYDIEPYLLPQYQNDQSGILTDYVNLVETLVDQDKNDKLPLTIIVPDFYTATQQWTPTITVDGITAYTYDHIVRLLNELSGSRIIVMAYRNTPSGSNGSIALSTPEIQGADNSNVTVLVAQETGPVTPSYVTFNDTSRSKLFSATAAISQAFAGDKSFGGIAIDYLTPFLNLQ